MADKMLTASSIDPAKEMFSSISYIVNLLSEEERPDVQKLLQEWDEEIQLALPGNQEFRECRIHPPFKKKSCEWQFDNWMPKNGDVLIATFPKTGTTWLREITRHLLYKSNEKDLEIVSKINQMYEYIDMALPSMQEVYSKLPIKTRIWVTHLPAYCVNVERLKKIGIKIFYVMRNPKDQLVSWYHFRLKHPFFRSERLVKLHPTDWDGFFDTHVTGQQCNFNKSGEWYPHHILSWYPYRNEKNVKFLYYEDLKKDPFSQIKRVAEFLEVKRSDEEIQEIANDTSFQSMKKKSDGVQGIFVRKGLVGDWKNYFTVAQSELMDEKVKEAMKDTDIRFTYEL